jgi:hypothetical protein
MAQLRSQLLGECQYNERECAGWRCHEPGSGHGQTLRTGLKREHLSGHDPRDRTPRTGEEKDVDADERDSSLLRRKIGCTCDGTSDRDDIWSAVSVYGVSMMKRVLLTLTHAHANSTKE